MSSIDPAQPGQGVATLDDLVEVARANRELDERLRSLEASSGFMAMAQPFDTGPVAPSQGVPQVSGLSLVPEVGTIVVRFNPTPVESLQFYEVQVATDVAFAELVDTIQTTDTQVLLAGLAQNQAYFVRVRAIAQSEVGGAREGPYSVILNTQTGKVQTADVQDRAISSAKIGLLAVLEANIAVASITSAKIEDLSVKTAKIGSLQVTGQKIGGEAVSTQAVASVAQVPVGQAALASLVLARADGASLAGVPVKIDFSGEYTFSGNQNANMGYEVYANNVRIARRLRSGFTAQFQMGISFPTVHTPPNVTSLLIEARLNEGVGLTNVTNVVLHAQQIRK